MTKKIEATKKYRGCIHYIEWTRACRHFYATYTSLDNVNIEERGSFYIVTDDEGKKLLRKRKDSIGTIVLNYDSGDNTRQLVEISKRYRLKDVRENSSKEAYELYSKLLKAGYERSCSGNLYPIGRKPSPEQYANGLEKHFEIGEQILSLKLRGGYRIKTWNGTDWDIEQDTEENSN